MPATIDPPVEEPPVPPTPTPPVPEPPPEPEPDEKRGAVTFGQRLNAAAQSLRGRGTSAEIEQLRGQVSVLTVERDQLRIEAASAKGMIGKLTGERDEARAKVSEAETALRELEKKSHDQKVIDAAIEMVAAAHVPVAELPISGVQGESTPQTRAQLEEAMKGKPLSETIPMLRAFNERNRTKTGN